MILNSNTATTGKGTNLLDLLDHLTEISLIYNASQDNT